MAYQWWRAAWRMALAWLHGVALAYLAAAAAMALAAALAINESGIINRKRNGQRNAKAVIIWRQWHQMAAIISQRSGEIIRQ